MTKTTREIIKEYNKAKLDTFLSKLEWRKKREKELNKLFRKVWYSQDEVNKINEELQFKEDRISDLLVERDTGIWRQDAVKQERELIIKIIEDKIPLLMISKRQFRDFINSQSSSDKALALSRNAKKSEQDTLSEVNK